MSLPRSIEFQLAAISALLYGWAYAFEAGFCHYFGISPKFISISITDVVRSGLAGFMLVVIGSILIDSIPTTGSRFARRQKVAIHLLAYGLLFGPILILELGLLAILYAPMAFVLLVIISGWAQDIYATVKARVKRILRRPAANSDDVQVPSITATDRVGISGYFAAAIWMLLYAFAFGHAIAKQKQRFMETPVSAGVVFVEKYGDFWVGKTIQADSRWGDETVLLKLPDGQAAFKEVVRQDIHSKWEFRWTLLP